MFGYGIAVNEDAIHNICVLRLRCSRRWLWQNLTFEGRGHHSGQVDGFGHGVLKWIQS